MSDLTYGVFVGMLLGVSITILVGLIITATQRSWLNKEQDNE